MNHAFVLENFFSSTECEHYIKEATKIGFKPLDKEYPKIYRNAERACVLSEELSTIIWKRMLKFLKKEDIDGIKPMDFNNDGVWKPVRVNEGFKFTKYEKGQYFKPHIDGLMHLKKNESTIHTIIVYLNDGYEGGNTQFIKVPEGGFKEFLENSNENYEVLESYEPKLGSCLIFPNYNCHAGDKLTKGRKYILRTELVFKRMNVDQIDEQKDVSNPNYQKMWDYYDKVVDGLLYQKNVEEITKNYLTAINYQYQHFLTCKPMINEFQIPSEIIETICYFLELNDIIPLKLVDHHWNYSIINGSFWKSKVQKIAPGSCDFYISEVDGNIDIIDWYSCFKREYSLISRSPLVVEFSDIIKILHGSQPLNEIKLFSPEFTLREQILGHGIRSGYMSCHFKKRWYIEKDGRIPERPLTERSRNLIVDEASLLKNGKLDKMKFPKSSIALYMMLSTVVNFGSVILLKPPLKLWSKDDLKSIEERFLDIGYWEHSIVWVDTPLMILFNFKKTSGIVIYIRKYVKSIALILNQKIINEEVIKQISSKSIEKQIFKMISDAPSESQKILSKNVILNTLDFDVKFDSSFCTISKTPEFDAVLGAQEFARSDLFIAYGGFQKKKNFKLDQQVVDRKLVTKKELWK
eukprot:gene12844-7193_t